MVAEHRRVYDNRRPPGITGLMEAFWEQVRKDLAQGYRTRLDDAGRLVPKRTHKGTADEGGTIAVQTFRFLHSEDCETWLELCGASDVDAARAHLLSKYWNGTIPRR